MEADSMVPQALYPIKIVILSAIIFSACSSTASEEQHAKFDAAQLQLQMQNGVAMIYDKPFTGVVYTLDENKKDTIEIIGFRHGREHGEWKKFYNNRRLKSIRFFDNGEKTGDLNVWWPDGSKQLTCHFKNGEYEGLYREWNDSGVLINLRTYKKGYEDGVQKQFYDDGKVKSNYVMINGKRYGLLGTKNCVNVTDSIFKK